MDKHTDCELEAARYRWIIENFKPQIMQNAFYDHLTLVFSAGIELPFKCADADKVTDVGVAIDSAILAKMAAENK